MKRLGDQLAEWILEPICPYGMRIGPIEFSILWLLIVGVVLATCFGLERAVNRKCCGKK